MQKLQEIRQQYPEYQDVPDAVLAEKLHAKFYSDMPYKDYLNKIGYQYQGENTPEASMGRTALDRSLGGATFDFADEVTDRMGAGIASLATGEDYDTLLQEARGNTAERTAAQYEQNPVTAIASGIGGALLTGGAGASTKAGKILGDSLRSGNLAARVVKGAAAGAASGGLYGAGGAEEGNRLAGAQEGAKWGAAFGGAIPIAGAVARSVKSGVADTAKGMAARSPAQLDDALGALRQQADDLYKAVDDAGVVFKPDSVGKVARRIDRAFKDEVLNPVIDGKFISLKDQMFSDIAENGLSLRGLDKWRRAFGKLAGEVTDKANARNASMTIDAIDDAVRSFGKADVAAGNAGALKTLSEARKHWSQASKFDTVADIVRRSEGDFNFVRREAKKLLTDKGKARLRRGFTAEEKKALADLSKYSFGEGIEKALGRFGFDVSKHTRLGNSALPLVGVAAGQTPLVAAGTAARQALKYQTRGKMEDVLKLIERGAGSVDNAARMGGNIPGSVPAGSAGSSIQRGEPTLIQRGKELLRDQSGSVGGGKLPRKDLRSLNTSVYDSYGGEHFGEKLIYKGDELVGAANISVLPGQAHITNIVSKEGMRRQGIASQLMDDVFKEFPDRKIYITNMTDDGAKFFKKKYNILDDGQITPKNSSLLLDSLVPPSVGIGAAGALGAGEGNAGEPVPINPETGRPVITIRPQSSLPLLDKIALAESGGNPEARNPNSSASGLYQFTNDTWKRLVDKHGERLGIGPQHKNDPQAQRVMAGVLARENADIIQKALKRQPTGGEIYLAHFFGAPDAVKVLRADTDRIAAKVTPRAAKANRNIFFDGKRPRTIGEVRQLLEGKVA